ncbi:ABC transporter substrate-binding protein [Modestobacter lapidis]|nr:ABC transporter substrate-binding protein [Modestobacter lapidis]
MIATRAPRRVLTAALALSLGVLAGCGGESDDVAASDGGECGTDDLGTVSVGYFAVAPSAPVFLIAERLAEEHGFEVEMTPVPTGPEILTGVATGQYDVGNPGMGAYVYNAHADGLPFDLVSYQHIDTPENLWFLSSQVAATQEEATELGNDLSALADQSFATVTPGGSTTYLLDQALEMGGLSIEDVSVEYMPFPDMLPALTSGAIAGATLPEPLLAAAEAQGIGFRAFPDQSAWGEPNIPSTVLAFNSDWSAEDPCLAEAYLTAFDAATDEIREIGWDDPELLTILSEYTDLPEAALASGVPSDMPEDLAVDFDVLQDMQEFFQRTDTLNYEELIDDEELFDQELRDRVLGN